MAEGLAAATANAILNCYFRATNITAPAEVWVQLHTGVPGAAGTSVTYGAASGSLGGLTGAAVGVTVTYGAAAAALGGLTASATGAGQVTGTASADLGGLTASATGLSGVTGTASAALGGLTGSASGQETVRGQASFTGGFTATATGHVTAYGTAAAQLGGLTATAAGGMPAAGARIDAARVMPPLWSARALEAWMDRLSTEWDRLAVTSTVDPTADVVEVAYTGVGVHPVTADWATGSWEAAALASGESTSRGVSSALRTA